MKDIESIETRCKDCCIFVSTCGPDMVKYADTSAHNGEEVAGDQFQ